MKKHYTFFSILLSFYAFSQSGNLDSTFGNNGKVHTPFGTNNSSRANAVAVQLDGKIVVGGSAYTANTVNSWEKDSDNLVMMRYNADGSIDTAFGYEGKVMADFYTFFNNNNYNSTVYSIKFQPDGKILAYGAAKSQTALSRYNSDGSIDTGFGNNGKVGCNSSPVIGNNTFVIQPDGKIVVLGVQWVQPGPNVWNTQFVVERYNADGSIDEGFATNGRVVTVFGSGYDTPRSIALQPDGKIIVAGMSYNYQVGIVRYTANGALDTTFDGDGKAITSFGAGTNCRPDLMTIHPDGKIMVLGMTSPSAGTGNINMMLIRYNANGSLDTGFDGDGKATNLFDPNDSSYTIISAAEQPDGKFLVTTTASLYGIYDEINDFVIRRYNSDATTDLTFGTNGKVATTVGPSFNEARDITLQPDGKILAAGYSRGPLSEQNEISVVRYESNGTLDSTFDTDGKVMATFDSTNDESNILLVRPDDKLIVIGTKRNHTDNGYLFKDIAISRYDSNGSLDVSFGTEGKVVGAFGYNMNKINSALLQPDGKIVLSNTYYNTFVDNLYHYELIRYSTDGTIDPTFGTDGKATIDIEPKVILSQPDGKIIAATRGYDDQNNTSVLLKRYNTNGTLDSSFGNAGTTNLIGAFWGVEAAITQPDGKIIVAVTSTNNDGANGLSAIRFNADGSLDSSFVASPTIVDNACYANGVFVQADGKIIITGKSFGFSEGYGFYQFVAARYNTNGSPDTTYGTNGVAVSYLGSFFEPYTIIKSVVHQPDGKFLVALSREDQNPAMPTPDQYDIIIQRFKAEGGRDNEFGVDGRVTTSLYNKYDEAFSIGLQADHKIVVTGTTDTGINRDFALVRYENTITLDAEDVDLDLNADVILYPNPVKNILNIKTTDSDIIGHTIYDMLGHIIYKSMSNELQVNTTNFSTGIYTIQITTNKGIINRKFVKE